MNELTEPRSHHDCQVLVIGSGAGGATTSSVLAEAGIDVMIVEEGAWVEQDSVVPFSLEQMDRQYRSGGVTVALGRPSIAYTEGRCAGGGTEINSGLYRRPSEATLSGRITLTIPMSAGSSSEPMPTACTRIPIESSCSATSTGEGPVLSRPSVIKTSAALSASCD